MTLVFFYPFDDRLSTVWLPSTSLPYFAMYARDLRIAGYRRLEVLRVYALNFALLPVIAGGVLKSIHQGITGARLPFGTDAQDRVPIGRAGPVLRPRTRAAVDVPLRDGLRRVYGALDASPPSRH